MRSCFCSTSRTNSGGRGRDIIQVWGLLNISISVCLCMHMCVCMCVRANVCKTEGETLKRLHHNTLQPIIDDVVPYVSQNVNYPDVTGQSKSGCLKCVLKYRRLKYYA